MQHNDCRNKTPRHNELNLQLLSAAMSEEHEVSNGMSTDIALAFLSLRYVVDKLTGRKVAMYVCFLVTPLLWRSLSFSLSLLAVYHAYSLKSTLNTERDRKEGKGNNRLEYNIKYDTFYLPLHLSQCK